MSYNGWKNYETWAVNLWIGNDEGEYNYWRERAREVLEEPPQSYDWQEPGDAERIELADELKATYTERADERLGRPVDVFYDLLLAALSEVDWYEIAQGMIESEQEVRADAS